MSGGRRVDPVDRAWAGLYAGMHISGLTVPPVEAVSAAMARVVAGRPDTPYGGTLDPVRLRWVPVPARRVDALVERVVVAGPDPEPGDEEAALERLAGEHPADLPVRLTVGPTSLGYTGSHMVGDAVTAALLLRSLLDADPGPVLRERRLDPRLLGSATLEQTRRHGREWGRLALDRARGRGVVGAPDALPGPAPADPAAAATPRTPGGPGGPGAPGAPGAPVTSTPGATRLVGTVLRREDLAVVSRWRTGHARGVSMTAVIASLAARSLLEHGVVLDTTGYYTLVDLRRYLVGLPPGTAVGGNLAKAVRLRADLLDPASVGRALSGVVASGRPLPATVIGAALAAARAPGPHPPATGAPLALTWNSVPGLPGMDTLPWLDAGGGRYVGAGFPVGGDGLSVVAHRLRSHLELTASVAPGTVDPGLVRQALAGLVDLARSELAGL